MPLSDLATITLLMLAMLGAAGVLEAIIDVVEQWRSRE